jgi:hypothetical protein
MEDRKQEHNAQSGALEISLGWDGPADLDLYVKCPDGKIISHSNRSACGGQLQIDMNVRPPNESLQPIEHVIFPSDVPRGALEVGVAWYGDRGESRSQLPVTILVKRGGGQTMEQHYTVPRPSGGKGSPTYYLQIPGR